MNLRLFGISHKTADLEQRESFILSKNHINYITDLLERKFSDKLSKLFDGMQPTFKQVPPREPLDSTQAVFKPSCAARIAQTYPPGPPPITIKSKLSILNIQK